MLGGRLVSQGELKSLFPWMSLPRNTSPVSRLVTTRSRLFTNFTPTAGLPGGSVQTSVARNGKAWAAVLNEKNRVCRSPVASALVAPWSNTYIEDLAALFRLDSTPGRLLGKLIRPHPW